MMNEIVPGCHVIMHFTLILEDGTVAEDSSDSEPLAFIMGDGSLIEGLEVVLYGLKAGDEQTVTLTPDQAFGFHDPENIHVVPLSDFSVGMQPEENQIIVFTTPTGNEVAGTIKKVSTDTALVDFNHPLAGHNLLYKVRILEVTITQDHC